jgi:hypothetical protein
VDHHAQELGVAASLLRLQLDTVLRLYALFWVADPEDFATKVFNGISVNKLKASDGSLMTDRYLRDRIASKNDWVPAVYAESSGYIHFSHRHIKAALPMEDSTTGQAQVHIGHYDVDMSVGYYGERRLAEDPPGGSPDCRAAALRPTVPVDLVGMVTIERAVFLQRRRSVSGRWGNHEARGSSALGHAAEADRRLGCDQDVPRGSGEVAATTTVGPARCCGH